jgi:phosphoserine phosphatase
MLPPKLRTEDIDKAVSNGADIALVDVDGTLSNTHIGSYFFYLQRQIMPRWNYFIWQTSFMTTYYPCLCALDCIDRAHVQKVVFNFYRKFDAELLAASASKYFELRIRGQLYDSVLEILSYLEKRVQVVLLSSNLDIVVAEYAKHLGIGTFHAVPWAELNQGRGDTKNLRDFKAKVLDQCYSSKNIIALADSRSDLPVLSRASLPIIVGKGVPKWSGHLSNARFLSVVGQYSVS